MERQGVHAAASRGYTAGATAYAEARPSFPDAAVEWLLEHLGVEPGGQLVEVGAGTGKLTRALVAKGVKVVAVEPVAAMRERLRGLGEAVTSVDALAEDLPVESRSVSAVIASQSLHWAQVDAAFAEFDRVLDHDGSIGLIWNFRDTTVRWQEELDSLLAAHRGDAPHSRDGRWERALSSSVFEIVKARSWSWSLATDCEGVLRRVRSVSYIAALSGSSQVAVDEQVRAILTRHDLLTANRIEFPYLTEAYLLRRR